MRNHTLRAAERLEGMLGDEQEDFYANLARPQLPDGPLAVGLDGDIVRARRGTNDAAAGNLFEVITGKSILLFRRNDPEEASPSSKCFALVRSVDKKPRRRLFELLNAQGMAANQQVSFFSDGGDTVRRLPNYLHPAAEL